MVGTVNARGCGTLLAGLMRACLALLAAGLVLGGCVYIPPIGEEDRGIEPIRFETGKTTRGEAAAILKNPRINEGRFIFDELHTTDGGFLFAIGGGYSAAVGYIPVGTERTRLVLEFDEADMLARVEIERSTHDTLPAALPEDARQAVAVNSTQALVPFKKGLLFRDFRDFSAAAFSPDDSTLAASDSGRHIYLYDFSAGRMERISPDGYDPDGTVLGIAFSPDGRTLAVLSRTIRLIDLPNRRQSLVFAGHGNATFWKAEGAHAMAFGPDGRTIASGGSGGTVKIWETATGRELASWTAGKADVMAIAVSPDGGTVATLGGDGLVRLWDTTTGAMRGSIRRNGRPAFSGDGRMLAIGSDAYLELWQMEPGPPVRLGTQAGMTALPFVERRPYQPASTIFTPDGRRLLHSAGSTAVWDWSVGPRVALRLAEGEKFLAFSPDGATMATEGSDGVRLWALPAGGE